MTALYKIIITVMVSDVFANNFPQSLPLSYKIDLGSNQINRLDLKCQVELKQLLGKTNDTNIDQSLLPAYDATGKLPSGLLVGNWASLGHFDECQSIAGFKYCLSDLETDLIANVFRWGLCIPQSCSEEDVSRNILELFDTFFDNADRALVNCAQEPVREYDVGFYFTVILCCTLIILMFASGIFDEYSKFKTNHTKQSSETNGMQQDETFLMNEERSLLRATEKTDNKKPSLLRRIFLCFAINRNIKKLICTEQRAKNIKCLNGIRVISMFWIILGHTSSYMFTSFIIDNPSRVWEAAGGFWMQIPANAFVAVDSFFFLSGLLVSYLTLQRLTRSGGSIPLFSFYMHRIVRLLPSYMFVILLFIYIVPYLSQGPIWFARVQEDSCQKYWWTNMLFINNFYPISFLKQCMDWSWYLANDMQFYIISPLLLLVIHRSKFIGISLIFILCGISIITTTVLMGINGFSNGFTAFMDRQRTRGEDFHSTVYDKPYCRITPYLVGIILGYVFCQLKFNNRIVKLPSSLVVVGWCFSGIIMLSVTFGLYPSYHGDSMSVVASSMYEGLSRFAWSVGLSWVVFACFYGYGGWVNNFLSSAIWVPLSRLVFMAYLVHPIMIMVFIFSTFEPLHYSYTIMTYYYLSFVLAAFGVAAIIFLSVELPFSNLVELLTKKKTDRMNNDASTSRPSSKNTRQCDDQV